MSKRKAAVPAEEPAPAAAEKEYRPGHGRGASAGFNFPNRKLLTAALLGGLCLGEHEALVDELEKVLFVAPAGRVPMLHPRWKEGLIGTATDATTKLGARIFAICHAWQDIITRTHRGAFGEVVTKHLLEAVIDGLKLVKRPRGLDWTAEQDHSRTLNTAKLDLLEKVLAELEDGLESKALRLAPLLSEGAWEDATPDSYVNLVGRVVLHGDQPKKLENGAAISLLFYSMCGGAAGLLVAPGELVATPEGRAALTAEEMERRNGAAASDAAPKGTDAAAPPRKRRAAAAAAPAASSSAAAPQDDDDDDKKKAAAADSQAAGEVAIKLRGPAVQIKRVNPNWKKGQPPLGHSDINDPALVADFLAFWQKKALARYGPDRVWAMWLEA